MNFLQWLTIAFTAFLFLLVASYWFGWSKQEPGKDYRWQMFSALLSIEGLLLGVFLQEGRVQEHWACSCRKAACRSRRGRWRKPARW